MEIHGKISHVGVKREGTGQQSGKEYKAQDIVVAYEEVRGYVDHVVVTLWNDRVDKIDPKVGDAIDLYITHGFHVNNGRFYNDINLVRISKPEQSADDLINVNPEPSTESIQSNVPETKETPTDATSEAKADDLPF